MKFAISAPWRNTSLNPDLVEFVLFFFKLANILNGWFVLKNSFEYHRTKSRPLKLGRKLKWRSHQNKT